MDGITQLTVSSKIKEMVSVRDNILDDLLRKRLEVKKAKRIYEELDMSELILKSRVDGYSECLNLILNIFEKKEGE